MNHRCKCSCGKYETGDLPLGIATSAAALHCLLDGQHTVTVETTDKKVVVATVTRDSCTYH